MVELHSLNNMVEHHMVEHHLVEHHLVGHRMVENGLNIVEHHG